MHLKLPGKDGDSMPLNHLENAVLQYYDGIMRYFVYRIHNRTAAEDLTQETFYRFIRYAGRSDFSGEKQCRAYLYKIASNVCRDYYAHIPIAEELDESIPSPDVFPENDLSLVIEAALGRLPDEQREATVLYYYGGFRVKEIAAIQEATVSAVKSRLKLARDTLRKILSEQEGFY